MKKVTYILGAGFSAPLGLPTMRNFFKVSQKSRHRDSEHFRKIFEFMESTSKVKNYTKINMMNIEELLSLLEMEEYLKDRSLLGHMRMYISDVIKENLTPLRHTIHSLNKDSFQEDLSQNLFTGGELERYKKYAYFILGLTNLIIEKKSDYEQWRFKYLYNDEAEVKYDIISLNYDMVIESVENTLKDGLAEYLPPGTSSTNIFNGTLAEGSTFPSLLKLHGSAHDPNTIIAPTWNKIGASEKRDMWKSAYRIIKETDELRIIGYSMPKSDSYFKYFLMAALSESRSIDKIQIFCLDKTKSVTENYNELFVNENDLVEFYDTNTVDYIDKLFGYVSSSLKWEDGYLIVPNIEAGHRAFTRS